jgi:hypothetical protein
LDARLATPVGPIRRSLFLFQGKNPLLQLIHGRLPQCSWLCAIADGALGYFLVSRE